MKKLNKLFGVITVAVVVGLLLGACASKPYKTLPSLPSNVLPGPDEAEVIVQYYSQALSTVKEVLNIYIDGELVAQANPDSTERVIVKNGPHTITISEMGKKGLETPTPFTANSERILFNVVRVFGMLGISDQTPGAQ